MDTLFITGFEDFLEPPSIGRLPNPSRLLIDYIERTPGLEEELLALSGFKSVRTLVRPVPRQAKLNKFRNKSRQSIRRILAQVTFIEQWALALNKKFVAQAFKTTMPY